MRLIKVMQLIVIFKNLALPSTAKCIVCLLKVNKTFEDFQILQEVNEAWKEAGPRIKNYMESSSEMNLLKVNLNSCYCCTKCVVMHFHYSFSYPGHVPDRSC